MTLPREKLLSALCCFLFFLVLFAAGPTYFINEVRYETFTYRVALMWSPALAVLATSAVFSFSMRDMGWDWPPVRALVQTYFLPFLYGLPAYVIIWLWFSKGYAGKEQVDGFVTWLGVVNWPREAVIAFSIFIMMTYSMAGAVIRALGEELGWRGFLLPLLKRRYGYLAAVVGVALISALWHYMVIVHGKFNAGPKDLHIQFANYSIMLLGWSFIHAYYRIKYRSIWPSVMLHAAHGMIIAGVLQEFTTPSELTWRFANEFGFILPLFVLIVGLFFWRRAEYEGLTRPNAH